MADKLNDRFGLIPPQLAALPDLGALPCMPPCPASGQYFVQLAFHQWGSLRDASRGGVAAVIHPEIFPNTPALCALLSFASMTLEPRELPAFTADQPRGSRQENVGGSGSFSLFALLVLLTSVALFLVVNEWSSLAAFIGTLLVAPALVRTTILTDRQLRSGRPWSVLEKSRAFAWSLLIVLATALVALVAFILVSLLFGGLGLLFGWAIGIQGLEVDTAVVGTAGGMIWGMGAALLTATYLVWKYWFPEEQLPVQ